MLIVEDGTGLADANSYVSVLSARSIAHARGVVFDLPDSGVESLLVRAMDELETRNYVGLPLTETQALSWPRDDLGVPSRVMLAQVYLAIALRTVDLSPTVSADRLTKREKVGDIEVEYESASVAMPVCTAAEKALAPYLLPKSLLSGVRA